MASPRKPREAAEEVGNIAGRTDAPLPERRRRPDTEERFRAVPGVGMRFREFWAATDLPRQLVDPAARDAGHVAATERRRGHDRRRRLRDDGRRRDRAATGCG